MAEFGLFGVRRDFDAGAAREVVMAKAKAEGAIFDAAGLTKAAAAADSLFWAYDAPLGRFEFHGDAQKLGLPPLNGRLSPQDLALLLDIGEVDRLEAALHTLDVLTAADLPGEGPAGYVQCVLRLRDQRCVYLKGRRVGRTMAMGTLTELSRDARHGGGEAGLELHDIHIDMLTGLHSRHGFLNAAQAFRKPGVIEVTAETDDAGVRIQIGDNGPGIPEEILPGIFRPNVSTKSLANKRSGLGLHIVESIVSKYGGRVTAANREQRSGALFTISLPPAQAARPQNSEASA